MDYTNNDVLDGIQSTRNIVDSSSVKSEEDNRDSDDHEARDEISNPTNESLKVWLVDEEGNVIEKYIEENGQLKPYVQFEPIKAESIKQKKHHKSRVLQKVKAKENKKTKPKRRFEGGAVAVQNESYRCTVCKFVTKGRKPFLSHLQQHIKIENSKYFCCFCCYSTSFRSNMNKHILSVHKMLVTDKRYIGAGLLKCNLCDFSHNKRSNMEKHKLYQHNIIKTKGNVKKLQTTQTVKTSDDLFECDYCGKKFDHKSRLVNHIHVHLGTVRHHCDECGYACLTFGDMRKHKSTHSSERPFKCSTCPKTFRRRAHALLHMNKCVNNKHKKK